MNDDEQYYDIPLDDHNVPYVTLEEMQELLPNVKLKQDEQTGLYYIEYRDGYSSQNLLCAHYWIELLMEDPDKVDWAKVTHGYDKRMIEYLEHLYKHPLVWVDKLPDKLQREIVVVGKIAQEKSSYERDCCLPYDNFFFNMFYNRVLWFADNMPTGKDYGHFSIYHSDFILWNYLTEELDIYGLHEDKNPIVFNVDNFLRNINYIAEHRGGAKATELVRLFRQDWPSIVAQKLFLIEYMSEQQIEAFRLALFEGMDRNLRKWEAKDEASQKAADTPQEEPCNLFTKKAKKEGKEAEIIEALKSAMSGRKDKARALVDEVRIWQEEGYMDSNFNAKVMYDGLKVLVSLPFLYGNFRKYYNE